jgi:two-component system cell cycle sensor histidine kinase/response regulator CckA
MPGPCATRDAQPSNMATRRRYDPQSLLNSQPEIVTVIDPSNYAVQFQNATAFNKLGDLSGQRCYEGIAKCPAPCSFCRMPETLATGRSQSNEVPLPNDQFLLVQWSCAPTDDGRIHVIETITDITERKRLERSSHHALKMDALTRLAGGVVQDLNNLLTVLHGHTQALLEESSRMDQPTIRLHAIRDACDRAAMLAHKLTAFTHHQASNPGLLNLTEAVHALRQPIEAMAARYRATVTWTLSSDPGYIIGERRQIERMLLALVHNACEAMPPGGAITVTTLETIVTEHTALSHGVQEGRYIEMSVADAGQGMTPDIQERLFEPFFTTKPGREAGLSLAMVYGVVRQYGGYVTVASTVGQGSVFRVTFPQCPSPMASTPRASHGAVAPSDTPQIVVVEDDEDVRRIVSDVLRHGGFTVHEAGDGVEALALLYGTSMCCVVTDMVMPRMTGLQLIEQVEKLYPAIPVLLMTAFAGEALMGTLPHVTMLAKPFKPGDLLATVNKILAQ